jgi:GTPase SAR1 family protein
MDLNLFSKKKEMIKLNFEKMLEVAGNLGLNDIVENVTDSIESIKLDGFNIVVVGEFSRGKSTFINALLGQRVLPSATKPTTTIINKISAGDNIEYVLNFRDEDKTVDISEEKFKKLVAPIEPDFDDEVEVKEYNDHLKYISSISFANIKYPTKLLKDGVEIIDTPGTNDLDQAREEITFKFIPQSDAAILVLSATQILSDSEVTFLKERILANDINKIFFVINAKDKLMSDEDEKKVFDYAYKHLIEYVKKPKIFLVSSRGALNYKRNINGETVKGRIPEDLGETGFATLENEIGEYLINERGSIKLNKYYNRGTKIATEIINSHIKLKLSTVDLSVKELEQKVNKLVPKVRDTQSQALQLINKLKSSLKGLENDYFFMYRNGLEEIALRANMAVTNYVGPLEIENIARYIEQTVAPLQRQLDQEVKDFKLRFIDCEINEAAKRLGTILDNLNINIENHLVVTNAKVGFTKKYNDVTVTNGGLGTGDGLFGGLLIGGAAFLLFSAPFIAIPAAMFGGKYLETMFQTKKRNNFLADVKMQIERRYGDIIPKQVEAFQKNYDKAISQSITGLEGNVYRKISSLEGQLNKLLDEKKQAKQSVDSEIASLTQVQKQLKVIITEFERELG